MRSRAALSLVVALAAIAPRANAQDSAPAEKGPFSRGPGSPVWKVDTGYRGAFINDPGLNRFSANDYFDQFSLGASRKVFERGRFAFAPGFVWDYGARNATARGAPSSLTVHRLTVPLELRFRVVPALFGFARVAAGVASVSARVSDTSAPAPLVVSTWVPAMDLSAGLAWRFVAARGGAVGIWLTGEGGYGWTQSMDLSLSPDLPSNDPRLVGATDLGRLALNGGFFRVGVGLSF